MEFDLALGDTRGERLAAEIEGALTVLRKVGLIVRRFDHWQTRLVGEGWREPIDGWSY